MLADTFNQTIMAIAYFYSAQVQCHKSIQIFIDPDLTFLMHQNNQILNKNIFWYKYEIHRH